MDVLEKNPVTWQEVMELPGLSWVLGRRERATRRLPAVWALGWAEGGGGAALTLGAEDETPASQLGPPLTRTPVLAFPQLSSRWSTRTGHEQVSREPELTCGPAGLSSSQDGRALGPTETRGAGALGRGWLAGAPHRSLAGSPTWATWARGMADMGPAGTVTPRPHTAAALGLS